MKAATSLSLRTTEGSVAISELSIPYEIASAVSLPRNDSATQSLEGEGMGGRDSLKNEGLYLINCLYVRAPVSKERGNFIYPVRKPLHLWLE